MNFFFHFLVDLEEDAISLAMLVLTFFIVFNASFLHSINMKVNTLSVINKWYLIGGLIFEGKVTPFYQFITMQNNFMEVNKPCYFVVVS